MEIPVGSITFNLGGRRYEMSGPDMKVEVEPGSLLSRDTAAALAEREAIVKYLEESVRATCDASGEHQLGAHIYLVAGSIRRGRHHATHADAAAKESRSKD